MQVDTRPPSPLAVQAFEPFVVGGENLVAVAIAFRMDDAALQDLFLMVCNGEYQMR
ncbi:hypothetical protein NBH20_01275 [Rhizobium sp. S153]|uniref:Uncharacterized protein n=1 Tax=Ciceribacter sichuanensis TaxID=2949647 RepID=A0ABT0V2D4_9HYPH|nr:hypothetical protein [Ciceribacter sp. S153]MCM2399773.1 hypothetical protein [Ciceribacter sp. S153]